MSSVIWATVFLLNYVLVVMAVLKVLRHPREPRAMIAWITVLLLAPIVGLIFFMLIGEPRLERTRRRRYRRRQKLAVELSRTHAALQGLHALRRLDGLEPEIRTLMQVATRLTASPPTHSNHVTIHHDEARSFQCIREAIDAARTHVHLEYYIFRADETGQMIRDALAAACARGVKCRLLIDYVGSWSLPGRFVQEMTRAGIEVAYFLPVAPWQGRWRINFRNHRKILIVDGEFAFTGSHNIGDEYRGRATDLGPWQDTNISVRGPAVQQLQEIFVEDWHYSTSDPLVGGEYFPPPQPVGEHIVQVVASGPDTDVNPLHDVVFAALGAATRSVCIMTPYFCPDTATLHALQSAAYRGATVQLVIPSRTDNRLVLWAGRSFYEELSRAGVQVYEFDGGMLHNKVVVVDGVWAMVGSANIDHRSFRINFEAMTVLYDAGLAAELLADFEGFRLQSRRVGQPGRPAWTFSESIALGTARLVSPLL